MSPFTGDWNNPRQLADRTCACEGACRESRAMPAYEKPPAMPVDVYYVLRHLTTSLYALSFRILRKFACLMVLSRSVFLWSVESKKQVGHKCLCCGEEVYLAVQDSVHLCVIESSKEHFLQVVGDCNFSGLVI